MKKEVDGSLRPGQESTGTTHDALVGLGGWLSKSLAGLLE